MSCGIIRGCAAIKINIKFNVVCIQIVPHCGTKRGNTVSNTVRRSHLDSRKDSTLVNLAVDLCTLLKAKLSQQYFSLHGQL